LLVEDELTRRADRLAEPLHTVQSRAVPRLRRLCGLPAMMIVAPIGAVFGAIAGWRLTGRSKAS